MSRRPSPLSLMTEDPFMAHEVHRLRALSMPELLDEYERVWGKPPRVKHRAYLWKRIAWKIQEKRSGGLSGVAKKRLEALIAELGLDFCDRTVSGVKVGSTSSLRTLSAGTSLVREWKGKRIIVRVLEEGFEYEGALFHSLTAVAKAVTGSHCSGPAFFGLKRGKDSA